MTVDYKCSRCDRSGRREIRFQDQVTDDVLCWKCLEDDAERAPAVKRKFRPATAGQRLSRAMGTNPDKIDKTKKWLADRGVECDFTPTGEAVVKDRAHEKQLLKAWKMVDFDKYG